MILELRAREKFSWALFFLHNAPGHEYKRPNSNMEKDYGYLIYTIVSLILFAIICIIYVYM